MVTFGQGEISSAFLETRISPRIFYASSAHYALREEARVEKVHATIIGRCANELSLVIPKRIEIWGSLLCDIFYSPCVERYMSNLLGKCERFGEFECISIDCTVKPTRPPVGETQHNRKRKLKESQAIRYDDQIHAIQIAREASGSVLRAEPVFSEKLA